MSPHEYFFWTHLVAMFIGFLLGTSARNLPH